MGLSEQDKLELEYLRLKKKKAMSMDEPRSSSAPENKSPGNGGPADIPLAQRAASFLTSPSALPFSPTPFIAGTEKTVDAIKNSPTPAEDLIPPLMATAGGIVGGAATLPSGAGVPFGATAGAYIGGQAGETARQYIRAIRGKETPKTPMEALTSTAETGAGMAALELGGAAINKAVLTPLARPIGRYVADNLPNVLNKVPVPEDIASVIKDAFKSSEIAIKESNIKREADFYLDKYKQDLKAYPNKQLQTENAFQKNIADEIKKIGGVAGEGRKAAGDKIKDAFYRVVSDKKVEESSLYKKIPMDAKVSNDSDTLEFIKNTFKDKGIGTGLPPGIPEEVLRQSGIESGYSVGKLESRLNATDPRAYNLFQSVLKDLEKPDLTFGDMKRIRTLVGEMSDFDSIKSSGLNGEFKQLYGNLTKDMQRTAEEGGFLKEFKEANSFTKNFYDFVKSDAGKAIDRRNPEGIIDYVVGSNTPSRINALFKHFDDDSKDALRKGFLNRVLEKGNGNLKDITKTLNSYTDETLSALFDGGQYETFKRIKGIANDLSTIKLEKPTLMKPSLALNDKEKIVLNLVNSPTSKKLLDGVIKSNDPEILDIFMKNIDKPSGDTQDILRSAFLNRIFENSTRNGKLDYQALSSSLGRIGDKTINSIFGPDSNSVLGLKKLAEISKIPMQKSFFQEFESLSIARPFSALRVLRNLFSKANYVPELLATNAAQVLPATMKYAKPLGRVSKLPQFLLTGDNNK